MIEQIAYILYSELLFYLAHTWQLIALTAVIVVFMYSIAGVLTCLHLNVKPG